MNPMISGKLRTLLRELDTSASWVILEMGPRHDRTPHGWSPERSAALARFMVNVRSLIAEIDK